jgi:hypothetical protein
MITNTHQRNPAPFSLNISPDELTILQGRKQHKGLIASAKVSKVYDQLEKVTTVFAKAGVIETPTKINLSRCANYLKIHHFHLSHWRYSAHILSQFKRIYFKDKND